MIIRVDLHHWSYGSGWTHSEFFDNIDADKAPKDYTAADYIRDYDLANEGYLTDKIDENHDIRVEFWDENNNMLSTAWLKG